MMRGRRALAPPMTRAEFRAIRAHIQERSGIFFADDALPRLEFRLRDRLQATDCRSYSEYYLHLLRGRAGDREFQEIVELVTTHETYFFRERNQLEAFSQELLPAIHERLQDSKRLRIWSAGCASGEEVYTIAMLLLEHGGFNDWEVQIHGSDISLKVLERARAAVYGNNSFRDTSPARLSRFFSLVDRRYLVQRSVRAMTDFSMVNLADRRSTSIIAPVDVIFCRNVLIYFHQDSRRGLAELFYRKIKPGGYLLLGHAESLLNVSTDFEVVSLRNDLVYRRPESEWNRR